VKEGYLNSNSGDVAEDWGKGRGRVGDKGEFGVLYRRRRRFEAVAERLCGMHIHTVISIHATPSGCEFFLPHKS